MDTDDLSNETYKAVIITAEKFNHNLTLSFGILASACEDDNDYLVKANTLMNEWKLNPSAAIRNIFFDVEHPTAVNFEKVLLSIQKNIEKVQAIPIEKRSFDVYKNLRIEKAFFLPFRC